MTPFDQIATVAFGLLGEIRMAAPQLARAGWSLLVGIWLSLAMAFLVAWTYARVLEREERLFKAAQDEADSRRYEMPKGPYDR